MVSAYVEGKVSTIEKLLEENSDDDHGYLSWMLGQEYSVRGDYQKALYYLTNRGVDTLQYNWLIGYAYAAIGEQEKALRVANFLEEKYHREYLPPSTIGIIYAGLNDNQNKLRWMKEAYRVKDYWPAYANAFKPFRNRQWYQDWFDLGTMDNPRDPWEDVNAK